MYFISEEDVQFVRNGDDVYVQAKLKSKANEDSVEGGFVDTKLQFF